MLDLTKVLLGMSWFEVVEQIEWLLAASSAAPAEVRDKTFGAADSRGERNAEPSAR